MERLARIAVTVAFQLGVALLLAGPIAGSNWGSNQSHPCDSHVESQCVANNGLHSYYLDLVAANQAAATRATCTQDLEPVREVSCSERTSITNVDVIVNDAVYSQRAWAWTACSSTATYGGSDPRRWCMPQFIRYNLDYPDKYDQASERAYIACQEFGHTLGLRHSGDRGSCMYPNDVTAAEVLTSHDVLMLNSNYDIPEGPAR